MMFDSIILWCAGFRKPKPSKNSIYFYADPEALLDTVTGDIWLRHTAIEIAEKRLRIK